jgi:hypothetical protein
VSSTTLPPWRRHLGGPNDGSCCCAWLRVVRLVVVVRPAWGRRWWFLLHVFLFGCPSRGLRPVAVLAQDPPMVAVVLRRASGSWCCLGSPLLNDDAMMPPRPANRFDRPWRISQSRFVLVWHSLIMVDPLLCRGARYARRCGALGCLQSLGIVIPRQHPTSTCLSWCWSFCMLARSCLLLGSNFSHLL